MVKTCYKCGYTGEDFSPKVKCCRSCKREQNKIDNARHQFKNRSNTYRSKFRVPDIGVYAFEENGEIVYVGSSDGMPFRLYEHYTVKTGKSFCRDLNRLDREIRFRWHVLWHGDNLSDAIHQEKMLIQIHQPKFNKIKYKNYEG